MISRVSPHFLNLLPRTTSFIARITWAQYHIGGPLQRTHTSKDIRSFGPKTWNILCLITRKPFSKQLQPPSNTIPRKTTWLKKASNNFGRATMNLPLSLWYSHQPNIMKPLCLAREVKMAKLVKKMKNRSKIIFLRLNLQHRKTIILPWSPEPASKNSSGRNKTLPSTGNGLETMASGTWHRIHSSRSFRSLCKRLRRLWSSRIRTMKHSRALRFLRGKNCLWLRESRKSNIIRRLRGCTSFRWLYLRRNSKQCRNKRERLSSKMKTQKKSFQKTIKKSKYWIS